MHGFQNVCNDRRPTPTDVLDHSELGVGNLIGTGQSPQLQRRLHDLVEASGAYWMSPRFEPTHRSDGNSALPGDFPFQGQTYALAGLGEAGRFQAQRGHDRERVVQLEEIEVLGLDPRLAVRGLG